jgi:hypothetical protein
MKNLKRWQKIAIVISVIIDLALVGAIVALIFENTVLFFIPIMVLIFAIMCEYLVVDKEHIKEVRAINLAKQKAAKEKRPSTKTKVIRTIKTVKLLGTRTAAETRILATYNFTVYSFLVVYDDGEREVVECQNGSKVFNKLLPYIEVNTENFSKLS